MGAAGRVEGIGAQPGRVQPAQQPQRPLGGQVGGDEVDDLGAGGVELPPGRGPGGVVDRGAGHGHHVHLGRQPPGAGGRDVVGQRGQRGSAAGAA